MKIIDYEDTIDIKQERLETHYGIDYELFPNTAGITLLSKFIFVDTMKRYKNKHHIVVKIHFQQFLPIDYTLYELFSSSFYRTYTACNTLKTRYVLK